MMRTLCQLWIVCGLVFFAWSPGSAQVSWGVFDACEASARCVARYDQEMLVQLVNEATERVESSGESAWAEFRQPGTVWNNGIGPDLFVVDGNGVLVVHPSPEAAGEASFKQGEMNLKSYVQRRLREHEAAERSWTSRLWQAVKEFRLRRQHYTRVATAPDGNAYVIGSSLKMSATHRVWVEELVAEAARRVEEEGEAAFPLFRAEGSVFRHRNTNLFVLDPDGTLLVEPVPRGLEGKNLNTLDPRYAVWLKGPIEVMRKLLEGGGSAWVTYPWIEPGIDRPLRRATYAERVEHNGKAYIVGTGVDLEEQSPFR